jgi:hypothetical protein
MVRLSSPHDYVHLFIWAAVFGAVGGLAYELLQVRSGDTGSLELPGKRGARYLDIGFLASLIVGAIAAIAISYFFTPEVLVKETVNGSPAVITKWQIVKVIPLSILVGSAGGAFLDAMRKRVMGQLTSQKLAATQGAAETAVNQLAEAAKTANKGALATTRTQIMAEADKAIGAATEEIPAPVAEQLKAAAVGTAQEQQVATLLDARAATAQETRVEAVRDQVESAVQRTAESTSQEIDAHKDAALDSINKAANYQPAAP